MSQKIKSFAKFFIGTPLTLFSLFFIGKIIFSSSSEIIASIFHVNVFLIILALLSLTGYFFLRALAWTKLLASQGHRVPPVASVFKFSYSETKRYIPANVFSFIARIKEFQELGVPGTLTIKLLVAEALFLGITSLIIGWKGFFVFEKSAKTTLDLINTYSALSFSQMTQIIITVTLFMIFILAYFFRKKIKSLFLFSIKSIDILALYLASWALFGVGNYFLITAFTYIDPARIVSLSSFFVLSWLIGYASFVAPMGLGVREALLTVGLSTVLPITLAASLAVLTRVFLIISELVFLMVSYFFFRFEKKLQKIIKRFSVQALLLALSISLYIGYFSFVSFEKHLNFFTGRFDLGNMDQTVWNTLNGRIFSLTNPDGTNIISRLAIHADFILVFLSPLYLVWNDARMLLLVQSVVIGFGAIFVYLLGVEIIKNRTFSCLFALSYLLNPFVQKQNLYDFHAVTLATTFLLASYYFFLKKRYAPLGIFLLLSVLTKEHMFLTLSLFGILFFIKGKKALGTALFIIGIGTFYALVSYFIPEARGSSHFALEFFTELGSSPTDIVKNSLLNPIKPISILLSFQNFDYFVRLLTPVGFLSLLSPITLLLATPEFLINLLAKNENFRSVNFHYAAGIIPFIYISSLMGFKKIIDIKSKLPILPIMLYLILFSILYSAWKYGPLPGAKNPSLEIYNRSLENKAEIRSFLQKIPPSARVAATNNVGAHLTHRELLYTIPRGIQDADVVIFLLTDPYAQPSLDGQIMMALSLKKNPDYRLVVDRYPFLVFEKKRAVAWQ